MQREKKYPFAAAEKLGQRRQAEGGEVAFFSPPLNQQVHGSEVLCSGECWEPGAHPKVGKCLADSRARLGTSDKVHAPFSVPVSFGDGTIRVVNTKPSGQCLKLRTSHCSCVLT